MKYTEIEYDLFEVNENMVKAGEPMYALAHCISADFAMAGGIVLEFNKRWDMKNHLIGHYGNVVNKFRRTGGLCIGVLANTSANEKFMVFNLITKRSVSQQPTYEGIQRALEDMMFEMERHNITRLAMPKIGCGIDGKDWSEVSKIIKEVFEDTDIEILICKREEQ